MTITIDYNKETFCACMLSWSQKELQLLLIRGADDKERSSGERNEWHAFAEKTWTIQSPIFS